MLKKICGVAALALSVSYSYGQTTYLQLGTEDYQLPDRLETRSGRLTTDFFTTTKPISRKGLVHFLEGLQGEEDSAVLTDIDRYNVAHAISVSGEWAASGDGAIDTRHKPWLKTFYKKQPDFLQVNKDNFFLVVNPVISVSGLAERGTYLAGTENRFASSRGIEIRSRIANRIGLYTYFADNQEQPPYFVQQWITKHQAVPGADYYQTPGNTGKTYDYLQARGYLDFAVVKDHVTATFGYDKHFIGDGIRSLFLSDFSAGATFLRLNTKIWKLNYQNLFLELTQQNDRGLDRLLPHKYATMHHLSINATRWLNIGLFESTIFSRGNHFEFSYMNPVIFYRAIERGLGSPDNVNLGLNFKAIALRHLQFYGQLFFDEFQSKELFAGHGWWGNKFGVQLGGKYFNAFGINNLDLQGEVNMVRPYTYTHADTTGNYTHYNQPLAHPLGAGFAEFIGVARYQPIRKLYLSGRLMYYKQGLDTGNSNFGSNIFLSYNTRTPVTPADPDHNYKLVNDWRTTTTLIDFNASYELKENLFIDLGFTHRSSIIDGPDPSLDPAPVTSTYFYGGVRLNIARRDYNFY